MSSKVVGIVVTPLGDGASYSGKIKAYATYEDMVNDPNSGKYGIVGDIVYHKHNNTWVIGFPNIDNPKDYTAIEVLANSEVIPAGTVDEYTQETYTYEVPIGMTHWLLLRSQVSPAKSDVVVDWGDGSFTKATDLTAEDCNGTVYRYAHTYKSSGKYIIKIYGKDYYGFNNKFKTTDDHKEFNLTCRILDRDLPIASHLVNLASMAYNSCRLLKVDIPAYKLLSTYNWANMLAFCINLKYAYGMIAPEDLYAYKGMCTGCKSLVATDFVFPRYAGESSFYLVFADCESLEMNIENLFPSQGFIGRYYNVSAVFRNCKKLKGTVPADILWNDTNINWWNPGNGFKGCSAEIRAQVPKAWGGTME